MAWSGPSSLCVQYPNKSNTYYVKYTFLLSLELQVSVEVSNHHQTAHKHVDVFYTY